MTAPPDPGSRCAAGKLELTPAASWSEVMTALYAEHRALLPPDASAVQLAFQVRRTASACGANCGLDARAAACLAPSLQAAASPFNSSALSYAKRRLLHSLQLPERYALVQCVC